MTALPRRLLGRHRASARRSPPGSRSGRIVLLPTPVGAVLLGAVRRSTSPGRPAACRAGDAAGRRSARSSPAPRLARRHRPRRPRDRRRPVHRAVLRRRAGLGRRGPSAPASSPPSTCSTPPSWSSARSSSPLLQRLGVDAAGALRRARRRQPRRRRRRLRAHLPTSPLRDFLSILFRAFYRLEVKGLENLAKAGPQRHHRAQPCQLPRRARWRCRCLDQEPVFAIDHGIAQRWWVQPFLKLHPRHAARSDQADGDAHADQRGQGRRDAGHLPRGPPHRHRQPDEGL